MKYWIGNMRKRPNTPTRSLGYLMDLSNDSDIVIKIHHLTEMYDDIISSVLQREIHIKMDEETTGKETVDCSHLSISSS